jgi:hypothetical protein
MPDVSADHARVFQAAAILGGLLGRNKGEIPHMSMTDEDWLRLRSIAAQQAVELQRTVGAVLAGEQQQQRKQQQRKE